MKIFSYKRLFKKLIDDISYGNEYIKKCLTLNLKR